MRQINSGQCGHRPSVAGDGYQAERIIEFAIGQQAGIGGDARTVELQLEALVEIESQSLKLLQRADGKCSEAELSQIKRAVGLSIGEIQVDILDLVGAANPDLDDLN